MISESAKATKEKLKKADSFFKEMESRLDEIPVKLDNAKRVLDSLYREPVINLDKLCEISGIKAGTMRTIINSMIEKELITQVKLSNKNKVIIFQKFIDVFGR